MISKEFIKLSSETIQPAVTEGKYATLLSGPNLVEASLLSIADKRYLAL